MTLEIVPLSSWSNGSVILSWKIPSIRRICARRGLLAKLSDSAGITVDGDTGSGNADGAGAQRGYLEDMSM
jgi:hypothetical protein